MPDTRRENRSRFSSNAGLSLALVVNDELRKLMKQSPQGKEELAKLQTLNVSATVIDGVALNLTGATDDAEAARSLAKLLEKLKGGVKGLIKLNESVPGFVVDLFDPIMVASTKGNVTVEGLPIRCDRGPLAARLRAGEVIPSRAGGEWSTGRCRARGRPWS